MVFHLIMVMGNSLHFWLISYQGMDYVLTVVMTIDYLQFFTLIFNIDYPILGVFKDCLECSPTISCSYFWLPWGYRLLADVVLLGN